MRILVVCSGNALNFNFEKHQAFIYDQVEALKQVNDTLQFDYFFIKGKGLTGYLSCLNALEQQLDSQMYHCIHAHVAVAGLLANLQRKVPVVTTFHGSDIVVPVLRGVSSLVDWLSHRTIYITQPLVEKAIFTDHRKRVVVPCGVDFELFRPRPKQQSRQHMGLLPHKRYVLFSSNFATAVKNYPLAKQAIGLLHDDSVELLELKNYSRQEVAILMTAVDAALMTSFWEGSPQFVKEALACNCPVVSTDVGDVRTVIQSIQGCYITTYDPVDVADKLRLVLNNPQPIKAREHIPQFDSRLIAQQINAVYQQL
ncbi:MULTISPECIES: glycosyltransferase [Spirosoma]|uniref:Glycosyltransferase n=1 Tax=Spirosoma liriopis TaxID=2937440 RepID=A0ABT0HTR3_9BACT|nr:MULTISPECIES: glycosyltransferase [Spirosoma]MCK8494900.1 glycosyltransferase [Spirosoma liriopis]UHG94030.1 glycosyltransferase [Spirosoma oryzicola]